jgi:cell division protein FtsB
MTWQSFIRSRVTTVLMSIALLFVMVLAAKILIQKYKIDQEVAKMQNQVQTIKKDNLQLGDLIKYFNTADYQEKAAREQLNLKKDGEFVVGLPQSDGAVSGVQTQAANSSNFKNWFNYFFSKPQ